MIKDKLTNYKTVDVEENIMKGLNFIANTDFSQIEDGKHVLSDDMFVNVQTYETKSDADFEAHRLYADIQYLISGCEKIGVTKYSDCSTTIPYNDENDIEFLSGNGRFYEMNVGDFMILYPEDAHKPSISVETTTVVRKAVVKVRL